MLRYGIAAILALCAVIYGLGKVYAMKKRCDILKALSDVFDYIIDYVKLYRADQKTLFEKIASMPQYGCLDFFEGDMSAQIGKKSVSESFQSSFEKSGLNYFLKKEDAEYLYTFFGENNDYDLETYIKKCRGLSEEYTRLYKAAFSEQSQKSRLFTSLSLLGGLFIIVVLI